MIQIGSSYRASYKPPTALLYCDNGRMCDYQSMNVMNISGFCDYKFALMEYLGYHIWIDINPNLPVTPSLDICGGLMHQAINCWQQIRAVGD